MREKTQCSTMHVQISNSRDTYGYLIHIKLIYTRFMNLTDAKKYQQYLLFKQELLLLLCS
jgi:hypothetical protein